MVQLAVSSTSSAATPGMDQNGVTVSINSAVPTAGTASAFGEEVSPLCETGILAEVRRVLLGSEGSSEASDVHRLTERGCPCTSTPASLLCSRTASALHIEPNSLNLPSQHHYSHRNEHTPSWTALTFPPCSVQRRPCPRTVERDCCRSAAGPGSRSHRRCCMGPRKTTVSKRHF